MNVVVGSDHAGYKLKQKIIAYLVKQGYSVDDAGPKNEMSVDYPDYAKKVAKKVLRNKSRGILVCGSGTGMVIAANRFKGIRASLAYDSYSAKMSRLDNDANILTLRARQFSATKTFSLIALWLKTPFSNKPRHARRIRKLDL